MPGRRTILSSAMFTLVLIAATSTQSVSGARADDECLANPNSPAPKGQHWYYRIDHANNKRQCWRLAPEGLPVQKSAPQAEQDSTADVGAPPAPAPRAQQPAVTAPANARAESAPDAGANTTATAAPVPWLNVPKVPDLPRATQPMPQLESASAAAPALDVPAPIDMSDSSPTGSIHNEKPQRSAATRLQSSAAPPQKAAEVDHTFALLMVMFALLAVTGPILHFTHRKRERDVVNFQPPRWAPVTALNAPAPRIRVSHPPDIEFARRPAPRPIRPPDQTERPPAPRPAPPAQPNERLAHALQQLVDRIQTTQRSEQANVARPARRADVEMMKSAR
ncbi:MAG TPA: hypothetical protein VIV34_02425 [Pseudolabrys sp.]